MIHNSYKGNKILFFFNEFLYQQHREKKAQLEIFTHIMRKKELENLTFTGLIVSKGEKERERQLNSYLTNLFEWIADSEAEEKQRVSQWIGSCGYIYLVRPRLATECDRRSV